MMGMKDDEDRRNAILIYIAPVAFVYARCKIAFCHRTFYSNLNAIIV